MALQNVEANITLDLYNHDTTPATVKAIQLDSQTRYVAARLQNVGVQYDVDENATVQLTVIRPDKVGVQITGTTFSYGDEGAQFLGTYAELTQVALAVNGKMRGQFKITSGDQILRTEIFAISNGEALDASTDEWAGEYDGYNLDELVEKVDAAVDKVDGMEADVSELKSGLDIVASACDYVFPQILDGYCVEGYSYSSTGAYVGNEAVICTSKFRLKSTTVTCGSKINLYALFDSNGVFIERITVAPSQKAVTITRSDAKYIALMFIKNNTPLETVKASYIRGVYIENDTVTLEVGDGKKYTTVLAAFQVAEKITDRKVVINIYEGDYDIYDELGGDDYLASISSSATWKSGIQPVFTSNIEINGIGNVILRMEIPDNIYTQYTYQATRLSQINNSGNIKISNITFISKNNRYAIHDECDNSTVYANTKHEYIDCRFYSVKGTAVIGIGASDLSNYLLKNCYLKNTIASTLYFHNWSNTKKGNLIIVDSVLENDNVSGSGIRLGVNGKHLFDVFVSSSYLHSLKVTSENASAYSNNEYRIICNNTNLSSAIIDSSIISSTYDPLFKTW